MLCRLLIFYPRILFQIFGLKFSKISVGDLDRQLFVSDPKYSHHTGQLNWDSRNIDQYKSIVECMDIPNLGPTL